MSDDNSRNDRRPRADYAAQMARAAFGRHYVDPDRVEQVLYYGEIVFRQKPPRRREEPR